MEEKSGRNNNTAQTFHFPNCNSETYPEGQEEKIAHCRAGQGKEGKGKEGKGGEGGKERGRNDKTEFEKGQRAWSKAFQTERNISHYQTRKTVKMTGNKSVYMACGSLSKRKVRFERREEEGRGQHFKALLVNIVKEVSRMF